MKPMMESKYVGWMAIRPLQFGDKHYAPGDRVPQKHLEPMRDPEVLVRTRRLAAVAKDMNKVPRYLRKDVTQEDEMRDKILRPMFKSQIGDITVNYNLDGVLPKDETPVETIEETEAPETEEEPTGDNESEEYEPEVEGNQIIAVGDILMEMSPEDAQALYADENEQEQENA